MKTTPTRQKRPINQTPEPFAHLVKKEHGSVIEALQLYGDFPQGADSPCSQDWQHVLAEQNASLFEQLRFDESDPAVARLIRVHLARIVATCQAWDKSITTEAP